MPAKKETWLTFFFFFSSSFPFFSPRLQFEYAKDEESFENVKEKRRGK